MASKIYTNDDRLTAMTILEANGGNIRKTARETGIARPTLDEWQEAGKHPPAPEKAAEINMDFLTRVKAVREIALQRLEEVLPLEMDTFKIVGALKLLNETAITSEVIDVRLADARRNNAEAIGQNLAAVTNRQTTTHTMA